MPPAIICTGATDVEAKAARSLAAAVEAHAGLWKHRESGSADVALEVTRPEGILQRLLARRADLHNAQQDAATSGIGKVLEGACGDLLYATPTSWVRRRRDDEPRMVEREALAGGSESQAACPGGLTAREEIADTLLAILARLNHEPTCVASFDDCPLLCPFGKACFAQVCVDRGLLLLESPPSALVSSRCTDC